MNCSFNIRYKPRTTRVFTKSDLTVYDSAGNTALNALTVYGKSEVVDGSIKSAGEGWATVDLGTLNWSTQSSPEKHVFRASLANISPAIKLPAGGMVLGNYLCGEYRQKAWDPLASGDDGCYGIAYDGPRMSLVDHNYDNVADFVAHISGVMLAYETADPTQGNTIAIKTDNGSGVDGTMAVFETGTPLRGIPDTDVRDVMAWNGSAGTVTKKCGSGILSDFNWVYNSSSSTDEFSAFSADTPNIKMPISRSVPINVIIPNFTIIPQDGTTPKVYDVNALAQFNRILIRVPTNITTKEELIASYGSNPIIYELATPTTQQLTTAENASLAGLRTFTPTTHAQNNAQTEMTINYTIRIPTN